MKKPVVVFATSDRGGCNYYRAYMPLAYLTDQGKIEGHITNTLLDYEWFGGKAEDRRANVLGVQRPMQKRMHRVIEQYGHLMYADMDDNLFDLPVMNPCYWDILKSTENANGNSPIDDLCESLRDVGIVTVSTGRLKNKILEKTKRSKKIHVIPNSILPLDPEQYIRVTRPVSDQVPLRIGYWGAYHHFEDFHQSDLDGKLADFIQRHKRKVEFIAMGWCPQPKTFETGLVDICPWVPVQFFYDTLTHLQLDICIGPLVENEFSLCKSNIKWLETAMIKGCFVGYKHPVFEDVVHDQTGFLVDTAEEFINTLERLLDDRSKVREIGNNAYQQVMDSFTIDKHADKWLEVFENLIEEGNSKEFFLPEKELEYYNNKVRKEFEKLGLEEMWQNPTSFSNPETFNIWRNIK